MWSLKLCTISSLYFSRKLPGFLTEKVTYFFLITRKNQENFGPKLNSHILVKNWIVSIYFATIAQIVTCELRSYDRSRRRRFKGTRPPLQYRMYVGVTQFACVVFQGVAGAWHRKRDRQPRLWSGDSPAQGTDNRLGASLRILACGNDGDRGGGQAHGLLLSESLQAQALELLQY